MTQIPKFKLNNGVEIPAIGTGSWSGLTQEEHDKAQVWLHTALQAGFRHIDTALGYGTEPAASRAIKQAGIPREEIWITTKLPWHHPEREEESINTSLKNLDTDYVDLWLLHWPQTIDGTDESGISRDERGIVKTRDYPFTKTWAAMENIYLNSKKAKAIGVSNFSVKNLEILLKEARIVPAVNQVELHPYLAQEDLLQYCKEKGIVVTAYTPTGYATVRSDPFIGELAAKYKVTPAQVILAWHIARGVVVVPASHNPEHQKENINLPTLDPEDVKRISSLDKNQRLCNKPDETGTVFGWTMEQLGW
ncbi:NADP-dependent oxidoreductase domain-containing protein [Irpex rosettiformis]|uniref:NADP-dependent oxidoreductase domain-containing protein n=1 Tax=Irpex rosettiformis TaxID=378272 RepID=A0ACB8UCZ9_9APHY|nr:NADP-dependent oxidoreductase domain-containing protein [Irpex rosettiformis]